jgi:hypothetical protein
MNTPLKAFRILMQHFQHIFQNIFKETENGNNKITESGNTKITEDSDY